MDISFRVLYRRNIFAMPSDYGKGAKRAEPGIRIMKPVFQDMPVEDGVRLLATPGNT
jgi:hypothetical protein